VNTELQAWWKPRPNGPGSGHAHIRDQGSETACSARQATRDRVAEIIRSRDARVVLAHSLGSVVTYEALWANPEIQIDRLSRSLPHCRCRTQCSPGWYDPRSWPRRPPTGCTAALPISPIQATWSPFPIVRCVAVAVAVDVDVDVDEHHTIKRLQTSTGRAYYLTTGRLIDILHTELEK
jgi:hypothetical protein